MSATSHPSEHDLTAFTLGQLPPDRADQVEQHVSDCQPCCDTMLGLSSADTFVDLLGDLKSRTHLAADAERGADCTATASQAAGDSSDSAQSKTGADGIPAALQSHPRYDVQEQVGHGGMGRVFRARHRMMDRTVALKVINPEWSSRPEVIRRFQREVKTAASLSHRNIVTAFDAEQAEQTHFLVMEYVEGTDLAEVVKRNGPLSVERACDYIRQAAAGFEHARQQGMVHRDIKPHNLMVTEEGVVKILDFGLAGIAPEASDGELTADSRSDLTAAGAIMGTPDFISPEQAQDARSADVRSDFYSLGATFHFLLTGVPPFHSGSVLETLNSHAHARPQSVSEVRADVPDAVATLISRMMAKQPEDRPQSHRDVIAALDAIENPSPPEPPALSRRWSGWRLGATVIGIAAVALGLVSYLAETAVDKLARLKGPAAAFVRRSEGVDVKLYAVPAESLGGQAAAVCDFGTCRIAVLGADADAFGETVTGLSVPVDGTQGERGQVVSADGHRHFQYEYSDGSVNCDFLGVRFQIDGGVLVLDDDSYRFDGRAAPGRLLVVNADSRAVTVAQLVPVEQRESVKRVWKQGVAQVLEASEPTMTQPDWPALQITDATASSQGVSGRRHQWTLAGNKVGRLLVQLKSITNGRIQVLKEAAFTGGDDELQATIQLDTDSSSGASRQREFQADMQVTSNGPQAVDLTAAENVFPWQVAGMQSAHSARKSLGTLDQHGEGILYYKAFWDKESLQFGGREKSMIAASREGARFVVLTATWMDQDIVAGESADDGANVGANVGRDGSAEDRTGEHTEKVAAQAASLSYSLQDVTVLAVHRAGDGVVRVTFRPKPESMWYCPGAVATETEDGLELRFVRALINTSPTVTYKATKPDRRTYAFRLEIPDGDTKIVRRDGDDVYPIWDPASARQ